MTLYSFRNDKYHPQALLLYYTYCYLCGIESFTWTDLKQFATILLLTTIFLQTFSSFVIRADYILNKDFIVRVLCINREKPAMHCDGKCYLKKKIKQAEKSEQKSSQTNSKRFFSDQFLITGLSFKAFFQQTAFYIPDNKQWHVSANSGAIFHPPQA